MRFRLWLLIFCLLPAVAMAGEYSSVYTKFDLGNSCKVIEAGDEYVYAGTWKCPGLKSLDVVVASSDDRDYVGFGPEAQTWSFRKTFNRFNTALSPIEWRLRNGKPIAAIERWRVTTDDEGGSVTWLVVTALKGDEACPVHYVAGSYPDANAQARRAADDLAEDFNCGTDAPTVDSKVGEPGITLASCQELASE
jgi:hypothetical protein